MLQKISLAWLLLFTLFVTSCVSKKKYQAATTEAANAKATNDSLMRKNSELQSQLNDAISSNKMLTGERDRYQKESDSARKELEGYSSAVNEYMTQMDEVEKKMKDKMADYAERGANVEYKNGMVYLTLDDNLLFRSGSSRISKDGETVLGTYASILNEYPKMNVIVVGHTDDRGGDNWALSTNRANTVVRALKDNKIDPARFTAAGQGEYNPVADNSTAEGRAQNRRTELILVPETFKLLNRQ